MLADSAEAAGALADLDPRGFLVPARARRGALGLGGGGHDKLASGLNDLTVHHPGCRGDTGAGPPTS